MRRMLWVGVLGAGCAAELVLDGDETDDTDGSESDTEAVDDTDDGLTEADCDDPGTPTTPTPAVGSGAAEANVQALACTRTAVALACELGVSHAYAESVTGHTRGIVANGVVDHDVGAFPNAGNPNTIAPQSYTYSMPVAPSGAGSTQGGVFGILLSGAVLDPATAELWNDDPAWRYEALRYATAPDYFDEDGTFHPDALGVDCNLAHVQPGGAYHYHGIPTSLLPATPAVTHVGWAADGAPIVIRYGHDDPDDPESEVRALTSSYRVKSGNRPAEGPGGAYDGTFGADWEYVEGLGDLDRCNGRRDTVGIDGVATTTYVYVLTDTFPFVPRCFTHTPDASFARGGPGGGGELPTCQPQQTTPCCGDDVCDGPETPQNCPDDCG